MANRPSGTELWPGARTAPFARDAVARKVTAVEGPLSPTTIAACMGITRRGVVMTLRNAMTHALENARALGCEDELRELFQARTELAREPWPW